MLRCGAFCVAARIGTFLIPVDPGFLLDARARCPLARAVFAFLAVVGCARLACLPFVNLALLALLLLLFGAVFFAVLFVGATRRLVFVALVADTVADLIALRAGALSAAKRLVNFGRMDLPDKARLFAADVCEARRAVEREEVCFTPLILGSLMRSPQFSNATQRRSSDLKTRPSVT